MSNEGIVPHQPSSSGEWPSCSEISVAVSTIVRVLDAHRNERQSYRTSDCKPPRWRLLHREFSELRKLSERMVREVQRCVHDSKEKKRQIERLRNTVSDDSIVIRENNEDKQSDDDDRYRHNEESALLLLDAPQRRQKRREQMQRYDAQQKAKCAIRLQRFAQLDRLQHDAYPSLSQLPIEGGDLSSSVCTAVEKTIGLGEIEYTNFDDMKSHESIGEQQRSGELFRAIGCYICKIRFFELHHFYDRLCPSCSALNWSKRTFRTDLIGRVILVTGARVKIGFECGRRLLECGATLIATSRFPHDCASRYSKLSEFHSYNYSSRLHIFGVDFRDLAATVRFTDRIRRQFQYIDAIVHNAAQTIRRPPAYYRHLLPLEANPRSYGLDEHVLETVKYDNDTHHKRISMGGKSNSIATEYQLNLPQSVALSQLCVVDGDECVDELNFPIGVADALNDRQQLDLRTSNSWTMLLDQIEPGELVEVFAVNVLAPFIVTSRLKSHMMNCERGPRFVVNVSAMEGQFYRHKGPEHPHTNMAKAALNMMTRTAAMQFAENGIYMNSVDTGWINDENPLQKTMRKMVNEGWHPPLDEIDAMARVLDPILDGYATGTVQYGKFLKDFQPTEW